MRLDVLRIPKTGRIYDLCSGWWPGMPIPAAHPPFQLLTYRTPRGVRNQRDLDMFVHGNATNVGFISEMVMCTMHSGTHIDSLSHITSGDADTWHGGYAAESHLGDFGPLAADAATLPPMLTRGVILDVAGMLMVERLKRHQPIDADDLQRTCEYVGVALEPEDVVLIRTGTMKVWPDQEKLADSEGAGITLGAAKWLASFEPSAVGADTSALELLPSDVVGDPHPVHRFLLYEAGIPILEWVNQEELVRDGVHEFLFVCLPLPITGATGSMVRPVAVV